MTKIISRGLQFSSSHHFVAMAPLDVGYIKGFSQLSLLRSKYRINIGLLTMNVLKSIAEF